jgi:hypothetical protein
MPAIAPSEPSFTPARRLVGWAVLAAMGIAFAVHLAAYLDSWRPAAAAAWALAPPPGAGAGPLGALRAAASAVTVAALLMLLILPFVRRHWPGLARGRGWLALWLLGFTCFLAAFAANELAFKPAVGAGTALPPTTPAEDLRYATVYQMFVLLVAAFLLFAGGAPSRGRAGADTAEQQEQLS